MTTVTFLVLEGVDKGRVFRDLPIPVTIGREEGNVLRLNDERVSRYHAKIQHDEGDTILTDLDSTNGTRVNGQRVRRAALLPNDLLAIAAFRYQLKFGDVPDDSEERSDAAGPDAEDDGPDEKPLDPRSPALRLNALPDSYPDKSKRPK